MEKANVCLVSPIRIRGAAELFLLTYQELLALSPAPVLFQTRRPRGRAEAARRAGAHFLQQDFDRRQGYEPAAEGVRPEREEAEEQERERQHEQRR